MGDQDVSLALFENNNKNLDKINRALEDCRNVKDNVDDFGIQLRLASYMQQIHENITDEFLKPIMFLQGKGFGYLTDKDDKGGYPAHIIKNVIVEAIIHGFRPTGNEFNIINGRFYATKQGFERIVYQNPNLEKLEIKNEPSQTQTGNWKVTFKVTYKMKNCIPETFEEVFPIPGNKGSFQFGVDNILGKAYRKIYKSVHNRITRGFMVSDGDINDEIGSSVQKSVTANNGNEKVSRIKQLNQVEQTE